LQFVIDEPSLDCDDLTEEVVARSLRGLLDVLESFRETGIAPIGILAGWGGIHCWRGRDVADVLVSHVALTRDESLLALGLLGKCSDIDDAATELDPAAKIGQYQVEVESYGIALAHKTVRGGRGVAVITTLHRGIAGAVEVACDGATCALCFVAEPGQEVVFWRSLYELEKVDEVDFLTLALRAFPGLYFAPGLNFGAFTGAYPDLRPVVVRHLSALNDLWTDAYERENGNSARISARIGIDVSIEGATRGSEALMRMRDVEMEGVIFRCEWHSKLEPHRNRIHFFPAGSDIDRPLIGIFCEHLPT
jgi:hypothetical protein